MKLNHSNISPKIMPIEHDVINHEIDSTINKLQAELNDSRTVARQQKIRLAIARLKSARTLIKLGRQTLDWAVVRQEQPITDEEQSPFRNY